MEDLEVEVAGVGITTATSLVTTKTLLFATKKEGEDFDSWCSLEELGILDKGGCLSNISTAKSLLRTKVSGNQQNQPLTAPSSSLLVPALSPIRS